MVGTATKHLTCTTNSLLHIDYGVPIPPYQSTDYRTSNRKYHDYMPPISQDFNSRVREKVKPELRVSEPRVRDDAHKSVFQVDYTTKHDDGSNEFMRKAVPYLNVNYLRNVEDKMFKEPLPPSSLELSETKEKYSRKYPDPGYREVFPPEPFALCQITGLGKDRQPPVLLENPGVYKHMDLYLTTNKLTHAPFTNQQLNGIGKKDIVTFYNTSDITRTEKPNAYEMHDKIMFKLHPKGKYGVNSLKRVPNFGDRSEYSAEYTSHTFSNFYPYLRTESVTCGLPPPYSNPWQDLSPPGMYSTESSHVGSTRPIHSVINSTAPLRYVSHDLELCSKTASC